MFGEDLIIATIKSLSMSIPPDTAGKLYTMLLNISHLKISHHHFLFNTAYTGMGDA